MFTVNTWFLPCPSHKNPYAYTTHTHPLTPPTPPTGEILWIILLSNWHSHGSLNFEILKPPLLSVDQALFFNKPRTKEKQWLFRRPQSVTCVHCTCFIQTDGHTEYQAYPNIPQTAHICDTRWAFADFSIFANLFKLQHSARFSQQGQVDLMWMTAQLLNQIWGFNISCKLDRM